MSIFPKRTLPGTTVTIHWNFNTAHLKDIAICPLIRIGVKDPAGNVILLIEKHILALPAIQHEEIRQPDQPLYLNKNTPLLVMADYLSGKHKKENLVDILQNIQAGRHYYFTYTLPDDAPLGKYSLVSEVHNEGRIRQSKTALDDFFYVEKVEVRPLQKTTLFRSEITNLSPEPIPVKIIDYKLRKKITPLHIQAFELKPGETRIVQTNNYHSYLSYNEERELIPLNTGSNLVCIRNPDYLILDKSDVQEIFLLHNETDASFKLTDQQQHIWQLADGIHTCDEVKKIGDVDYEEMLKSGLIKEIIF